MAHIAREKIGASAWGVLFTGALAVLIVFGSRNLDHFDAAPVGYTFATLVAAMWRAPSSEDASAPRT